jgi:hypothetical protein
VWPAWRAGVPTVVALALLYEVLSSAVWIGRILSFAAIYDAPVFLMVGLRAVVTAMQMGAAMSLWQSRPAGVGLTQISLAASALLGWFEIGVGLAPSSVPPGQRGLRVAAYGIYAIVAIWLLRRARPGQ